MKSNLLIVLATILLAACGAKNSTTSAASSANGPSAKPAVGDLVVAKLGANWFSEGKIRVLEGQKANIGWSNKDRAPEDVDLANVYPMPKSGASIKVKAGDFALAKTSTASDNTDWDIVQVTSAGEGVITVKDANNSTYNLAPDKVIAVSPTDAADIKAEFDKNNKERDFDEKAHNAGRPAAPVGYSPKVGETVVADWGTYDWRTGQVKSITGDQAKIVWDPKDNSTFDTTLDKIVPYPSSANTAIPSVNDYILIKPSGTGSWTYVQVTGINGTNVVVKDKYDKMSTIRSGEFILLK